MNNLRNFMRNLPLLTASQASVCQVDILGDDLLSELGAGGGNFSSVNSLAAFDMANDLAGLEGLDMAQIMAAVNAGGTGKIVDVEDEEDGEHVEIYVE